MKTEFMVTMTIGLSFSLAIAQEPVQLTHHPAEDRAPVWSPDGARVAFLSERHGNRSVYFMDMDRDGSNVERITSLEHVDHYTAWSPDGTRIVFQSERDGVGGLWIQELASGDETLLIRDSAMELMPDWSPDGRFIAFTSDRAGSIDLWAMPVGGSALIRLTTHAFRDVWSRWSPDGESILFFSRRDTGGEWDELYVMDWESRAIERVTHNPTTSDFCPDWSPDGRYIVTAISNGADVRALVIYDRSGRELHRFAESYHRVFHPAWSPDGRAIAYAARAEDGHAADIFLMPVTDLADSPLRR